MKDKVKFGGENVSNYRLWLKFVVLVKKYPITGVYHHNI